MSHAPRQRLPDVAEKGGSDPSSAMSKWRLRWPWYQRSITLRNVAVLWPRRLTTRCLPRLTPLPLRLLRPTQEYVTPALAVPHVAPVPVIEYVSPAPVIEYVAPAVGSENIAENPVVQEQVIVQEIPDVVVPLLPVEEFTEPVHNSVHHEQIVAGAMPQNIIGTAAVQEQVIVQDIPPVVERIQEQIVDTIDVTLQGSQFAPNTSSTSTSHFDITSSSSTSTTNNRLDALASMLDSCREQLTELERIETLTKRLLETPLPEPPIVEPSLATSSGLTSVKLRRRTQYTPLPGIMEHAVYLAPSAWPPIRHA